MSGKLLKYTSGTVLANSFLMLFKSPLNSQWLDCYIDFSFLRYFLTFLTSNFSVSYYIRNYYSTPLKPPSQGLYNMFELRIISPTVLQFFELCSFTVSQFLKLFWLHISQQLIVLEAIIVHR